MALKDLFRKYDPAAQIYLTVVDTPEAELPPDQLRMLLCDAKGVIGVADVAADFFQGMADKIEEVSGVDASCAAVRLGPDAGMESSYVLVISSVQARALDAVLHAIWDIKKIPDDYIDHLGAIIRLGRDRAQKLNARLATRPDATFEGIHRVTPSPFRGGEHDHDHDHELPPNISCPKCHSVDLEETRHREGESPEYRCHVCGRQFTWP